MIPRPTPRFELWHTIATLVALMLAIQLLGFSLSWLSVEEIMPAMKPAGAGLSILSLAAILFLLMQLRTQAILLLLGIRQRRK